VFQLKNNQIILKNNIKLINRYFKMEDILKYKIIVDFYNTTSYKCRKADKYNEKIYRDALKKTQDGVSKILKAGLHIDVNITPPPSPNNYENFILWHKRNVNKPVIEQSEAVFFLTKNGYELNKHYEAYQAIDYYKYLKIKLDKQQITRSSPDLRETPSIDFLNLETNESSTDNNCLELNRSKSISFSPLSKNKFKKSININSPSTMPSLPPYNEINKAIGTNSPIQNRRNSMNLNRRNSIYPSAPILNED
jgi:hypothetical protein